MNVTESKSKLEEFVVVERAVLYARVSGDDRGKEGRNLQGQLDMGREYACKKGYRIVAELAEDDKGASGAEIDLPQLNRVREMADAGELDVLIVRELDRLSRKLSKQLVVEEELKGAGVRVEYVLAEYDDTPEGKFQKYIRATVAEYERDKIKERLLRGKRLKIKKGKVTVYGMPPYGYRVSEDKSAFEICESEAEVIKFIYQLYLEGATLRAIRAKLTEMGIPPYSETTGRRSIKKAQRKGEWNITSVSRILKNETYAGVWRYGKTSSEPITVAVPIIIPREMWEAVQAKRRENVLYSKRNTKREYLLAKCCWCGGCGYKMGALFSTRLYYGCPSFHPDYIRQCDMPQFRVKEVDDVVWNWIQSLLLDPETLDEGLNEYQAHQREKDAPVVERLKLVDNLLTEQNTQLKKLLDLYLSGDFPREMLTERKNHLETTIASLQDERAGLITRLGKNVLSDDQIKSIKEFAAKVAKGIKVADKAINFAARREIIELLDVQVTLTVENGLRVAYARCRLEEKQQRLSIMYNSK